MLDMLVAAAKILSFKVDTYIHPACLPCLPAWLSLPCLCLLLALLSCFSEFFWELIWLEKSTLLDIYATNRYYIIVVTLPKEPRQVQQPQSQIVCVFALILCQCKCSLRPVFSVKTRENYLHGKLNWPPYKLPHNDGGPVVLNFPVQSVVPG